MANAQLSCPNVETEAEVEAQIAADLHIQWETPSTPPNPDDYVIVDGTRMVRPYFFEFLAYVKRRWAGKTVVDLFTQEFRQRPRDYYEEAVKLARIRVEGKMVAPKYVLRDSQRMSHFVHRHEPPVLAGEVIILEEGPDVMTVCKPASVPVHPCGQYRKNTVLSILEAEHKTGPLFPVHRLDRLVSGLLILARNSHTADFFRQEIEAGIVQKQYVAKVKGLFPADEVEVNAPVIYNPREGRSSVEVKAPGNGAGGEIKATDKGGPTTDKLENELKGKEACTKFQRLSTDGVNSIVCCMPQTGRTHQIRVHLQHLGHPIANDALYLYTNVAKRSKKNTTADRAASLAVEHIVSNNSTGQEQGHHGRLDDLCKQDGDMKSPTTTEVTEAPERISESDIISPSLETHPVCQMETVEESHEKTECAKTDFIVDPLCTHCPNLEPSGYIGGEEGLWLHCIRYKGSNWMYECPLPQWAL